MEWLFDTKNIGSRLNLKFVFLSLSYCTQQRQILRGISWHHQYSLFVLFVQKFMCFFAGQFVDIRETFDQIKVKIVPF